MSLFGQSGSASGTGGTGSSSLFGSLNLDTSVPNQADPATKRKSVFEPSSTTEGRSKSNMFNLGGSSAAGTSAPSGSSLFGATQGGTAPATTAASSGGIFGSTTATPGTGTGGGLNFSFNKPATTTAAPSAGLFGATSTTQPAAKPSLFGLGQPGASTQAPSGSLFGTTQPAAVPNLGTSTAQNAPQPDNQMQNRESVYFNGLLERQKKKVKFDNTDNQLGQLPSMNMDLGDLARRAQDLGQKTQKLGQSTGRDSRAHYLLSGSGVTPGQAYREFQKLDTDAVPAATSTRIDFAEEGSAYLKGMQARGREAMLRESMDRVYQDVDKFIEESLGIDFDEQKKRIMQHFGLMAKDENDSTSSSGNLAQSRSPAKGKSSRRSIFGRSGLDKSIIGSIDSSAGTSSFFGSQSTSIPTTLSKNQTVRDLREKERLFMQKVEALNKKRLDEESYKVLSEFKEVEASVPGDVPKQLVDAYVALGEITKESFPDSRLRERCYAEAHARSTNANSSVRLKKQILDGSRNYLEKSFYQELEQLVQKNPRAAQVGGMPTILNKIRGYIRIRSERHDLAPDGADLDQIGDNEDYCWIIVFYLLRSGHVQEAVDYVNGNSAFQSLDRRFVSYLTSFANSPDRRLGRKLQEMINGEYQQRTRVAPKNTVDPYRIACYKIVGRCDLAQRNLESIGQGVEDWIWLQFALGREAEALDDATTDVFGLEQIVETIAEIGSKHFQKGHAESQNSYGTFYLMQILAGMFEQAVDYLHSFNPVSAVHAAIALDYYGLLRVSDFQTAGNELRKSNSHLSEYITNRFAVTYTTTQQPQINFIPLIAYYTTSFRAALPIQAVDYIALICLNSDLPKPLSEIFTSACHECLRELCLETREFAALLGDIKSDGSRIPGAIEQRAQLIHLPDHAQFLRFITSQAAAVADSRGQTSDAVLLYHLCEDYDNVISVLNRALADAVAVELGDAPLSLQPLRPRSNNASPQTDASSSLSLTQTTNSPLELAQNITHLYNRSPTYYRTISVSNRETATILITLLQARALLESSHPDYLAALERINSLAILPLDTKGEVSVVRQMASKFSNLPSLVTRCAGLVILWCVRAIGAERDRLAREGSWEIATPRGDVGNEVSKLRDQLGVMARDLMVFAGLVKYKLPGRVYESLTRVGGDTY